MDERSVPANDATHVDYKSKLLRMMHSKLSIFCSSSSQHSVAIFAALSDDFSLIG